MNVQNLLQRFHKYAVALAFLGLVISLWCVSFFRISRIYVVDAACALAPESDAAITEWIGQQPGVVGHTVQVVRRKEQRIEVSFLMSHNFWLAPAFPNLESAFAERGYELVEPFDDVPIDP
jgi:hypothetical protein